MRLLVTGSRGWADAEQIRRSLNAGYMVLDRDRELPVLVHGGANMRRHPDVTEPLPTTSPPVGADAIADQIWRSWGLPVEIHFADWRKYGKAAGPLRNQHMVDLGADLVCGFLLDASPGTTNCLDLARKAGLRLDVIERRTPEAVAP